MRIGEVVLTHNDKPLLDKDNTEIKYGDIIEYEIKGEIEFCVILPCDNPSWARLCLIRSMWYGDNKFDKDSYGKTYFLKLDNGSKMQLRINNDTNTTYSRME